jgi:hypothetical protein
VFFRETEIYYILNRRSSGFTVNASITGIPSPAPAPKLEIGVITDDVKEGASRLSRFREMFEQAVKATAQDQISLSWSSPAEDQPRIEALQARLTKEGASFTFAAPNLTDQIVGGANSLSDQTTREVLQELSRAGFAREQDVLDRRARNTDEFRQILDVLTQRDLLNKQYLLQCRTSSNPLTRLNSPNELKSRRLSHLPCGSCGRPFSDELLVTGYSVSSLGKELIQSSHWMTVWVTTHLIELGVSREAILWNLEESTEEVDLLLDFLDELWIFELKDRSFEPRDALPLNYRRVRYGANKAIVISTDHVSPAAKRVFADLAREATRGYPVYAATALGLPQETPIPVYIDGLSSVTDTLHKELASAALRHAERRLKPVSDAVGYRLEDILPSRFEGG